MKKILLLAILICLFVNSIPAYAHEIGELEGQLNPHRWGHVIYNYRSNGLWCCVLKVNGDYLYPQWHSELANSCNNWNDYSGGQVSASLVSYQEGNVLLANFVSWPENYPSYAIAVTFLADTNGEWHVDWSTLEPNYNCQYVVYLAHIYPNPNFESNYAANYLEKRKALTHEIGHVLGLGHEPEGIQSIMRQGDGISFGWSNYYEPQPHDVNELTYRYNN